MIVDEIIDTGLTLSWLTSNLASREPASVEICTLLRKPEALQMPVDVKYVGWDIPNEFVVGYGLDYRESTATCATSAPSRRTSTPDGTPCGCRAAGPRRRSVTRASRPGTCGVSPRWSGLREWVSRRWILSSVPVPEHERST